VSSARNCTTLNRKRIHWKYDQKNGQRPHFHGRAIPKSNTRSSFGVDGEVLGISLISDSSQDDEGIVYTLDGRQLEGKLRQEKVKSARTSSSVARLKSPLMVFFNVAAASE